MLTAAQYYSQIVRPTVDEFCAHNSDVRLAMLACMATVHVVDHVVQNRLSVTTPQEAQAADDEVTRITNDLAARHTNFAVVRAYGLASKHGRIGLQRKFQPGFDSGRGINRPPAFWGRLEWGRSFWGDKVGGITIHWTEHGHINLTNALRALLPILEAELPELTAAPASPGVAPSDETASPEPIPGDSIR